MFRPDTSPSDAAGVSGTVDTSPSDAPGVSGTAVVGVAVDSLLSTGDESSSLLVVGSALRASVRA